jgi:hypothetical protein
MVQANSVLLSSGYLLTVHKIRSRSFWLNSRWPIQNGVFHFVIKVNHPDSIVRFVFHFVNQVQVNLLRSLSTYGLGKHRGPMSSFFPLHPLF